MNKDNDFEGQKRVFRKYLETRTTTAAQAALDLGIWRANTCRFKRQLEKEGLLVEVSKAKCPVTGFQAAFLSCDKELVRISRSRLIKQGAFFY